MEQLQQHPPAVWDHQQQQEHEGYSAELRSSAQGRDGQQGTGYPAAGAEDDSPLFQTDDFRIWCMKVIPCTKRFVHDWTVCPFAHAGEKAVRRDPRMVNYTGIACPDMKKTGNCIRGDRCPYAHNVFEYWLHPTRYRTQLCNDGPMCKRGICFFAHSLEQLRVPACKPYVSPEALARASLEAIQQNPHPLAQQLPNPVTSTQQQQQAALLAMTGPPAHLRRGPPMGHPGHGLGTPQHSTGSLGVPNNSASSFSAAAAPFVPGGGGSNRSSLSLPPLGPSTRHSFDFGALPSSNNSYSLDSASHSMGSYRPMPHVPRLSTDHSTPPGSLSHTPVGRSPVPAAVDLSGHRPSYGVQAVQHMGFHQFQQAPPTAPAPTRLSNRSDGPERSFSPACDGGEGQQPQGNQQAGFQQQPHSGMTSPDFHAVPSTDSLPSMASTDGLAHSLASLKIAMTQQQLAATAGSNHEVVISTLHQILKEAAAQQGPGLSLPSSANALVSLFAKSPSAPPSLPTSNNASGAAGAAAASSGGGQRAPYFIQDALGSSATIPSRDSSSSGGSTGRLSAPAAVAGQGTGSVRNSGTAQRSPVKGFGAVELYSPDNVAAFQAASTAAAGGYFGTQAAAGPEGELVGLEEGEQLSQALSAQTYSTAQTSSALSQLSGLASGSGSAMNSASNSANVSGSGPPVIPRTLSSGQLGSLGGSLAQAIGN